MYSSGFIPLITRPTRVTESTATLIDNIFTSRLKVDYLIICIICDTDLVNKLTLQMYILHKYK